MEEIDVEINLELMLLIEDKLWQSALILRQSEESKLNDGEVEKLIIGIVKYSSEYIQIIAKEDNCLMKIENLCETENLINIV